MTAFKFIRPTTVTDSAGSFTRSTTATYFDVDGVMQTAAIDVPRIGYNPSTHAHTGLILEGAGTNLFAYSEDLSTTWTRDGVDAFGSGSTVNAVVAPDGTSTADMLKATAGGTSHNVYQFVTLSITGLYTLTFYAKANAGSCVVGQLFQSGIGSAIASFNVLTGEVVGTPISATATIQSVGNGWYRCSVTCTFSMTAASSSYRIGIANPSGDITFSASGTETVYLWGAQLEAGSIATSYIKTVAAAVTRAADIVTGSGLIYTDVPENDYPAWVGGTTYTALTSYVIRTTATTHKVYQCLVTHTTTATPEDNTTGVTPKWLEIGPTNRWGMFDRKVGTETTQATSMTYLLKPGRANSLGLLGIDADSVEVSLVANDEIVYAASIDLNSGNTVGDWYQYFYEPIYSTDAVAITNLLDAALMAIPAYGDGVLCVRFLATAGDVTCGVLAVGLYAELGTTLYDPTIGIIDYSRKSVDAFGNYDITERTYSKRMSATLMVESTDVDNTARLLTQYRATPVVWVGADNLYSSLIVYGFAKDWEETIKGPTHSTCNIQIEGLT